MVVDRVATYQQAMADRDTAMVVLLIITAGVALAIYWYRVLAGRRNSSRSAHGGPRQRSHSAQVDKSRSAAPFIFFLVAGSLARLALVPADNLWYDEAFTFVVSGLPWDQMAGALLGDVHPPGWYLVSRLFAGGADWMVRVPAALCSVGALFLFAWWVRRVGVSRRVQLWALMLMAFAPIQFRMAAEARMYAALTLAGMLMLAGVTLNRPKLTLAGMILAPWLQHVAGWLYVGTAAAILFAQRRLDWRRYWPAAVTGAPMLVMFVYQATTIATTGWYWLDESSLGAYLHHAIFSAYFSHQNLPVWAAWPVGLAAFGLAAMALASSMGKDRRRWWAVSVWGFAPGLVLALVSQVKPLMLFRVLLPGTPALYLLTAQVLGSDQRRRAVARLAGVAVGALMLVSFVYQAGGNVRGETFPLLEAAADCDILIHSEPSSWLLSQVYAPDHHHILWDEFPLGLMAGAMSERSLTAMGAEYGPLGSGCVIYEDHAAMPREALDKLDAWLGWRVPDYVLSEDKYLAVRLYK